MSSTIQTRVISAANDNVISMSNSTWARGVTLPANWSKVRLGLRLMLSPNTQITSGASFAMGFCSGVTNMVGDYLTTNFIGAGNVVGGSYNGAQFDMTLAAMKKVGTTTTIGTSILRTFLQAGTTNTSANQDMIFVDILKGSPNYSVFMFGPNINGGFTGCTSAQFFTQVIAATPSFGQHAYTGAVTIPFDESAGPLNAVSVWWGDTAVVCEINDMAVVLLA